MQKTDRKELRKLDYDNPIDVHLVACTDIDPLVFASFAAKTCYDGTLPKPEDLIDIKNTIFRSGHHTVLQHWYASFAIEGIGIGDVTTGLHLVSPFYNSSQRSGRYCIKMFSNPDFDLMRRHISRYWPGLGNEKLDAIMEYIRECVSVYTENIEKATEIAARFMKEDRPHITQKDIDTYAERFAQEQLRAFVPVIFPTALVFTVNLSALTAMYHAAWNPIVEDIARRILFRLIERYPSIAFLLDNKKPMKEWGPDIAFSAARRVKYKPEVRLGAITGERNLTIPDPSDHIPLDLLHFSPEFMGNNEGGISSQVLLDLATVGQDQRHRLVKRTGLSLTNSFYLPPVPAEIGLEEAAKRVLIAQKQLCSTYNLPTQLRVTLSPYGRMARYGKNAPFNALIHEQGKRGCQLAQEPIYHMFGLLRQQVEKRRGSDSDLLSLFEPPCLKTGKCVEPKRYCGRDLKTIEPYIASRRV